MESVHAGIYPLAILAFVLGMKHGMDADHLATIDGLTRFNASAGRTRLARVCGLLFSLGHGGVVCVVAVATSMLFGQGAVPEWLDGVGVLVSSFFLITLGALNLYAVFSTPAHETVQMVGLRGRWLGRLAHAGHPVLIALVGSLFAISFDTLSQAALFSTTSIQFGGSWSALLLAICFTLGMVLTDAVNGLWISHLLRRADATARAASRLMGITVAALSLTVAALGLSRRFYPEASSWQEGNELIIGGSIIAVIAACYLLVRLTHQRISAVA